MKKTNVTMLVLSALSSGVFAQSDPTGSPSTVLSVGEVVVTAAGGALSPRQVLTSVNVLPQERIENQPVYSNYELLNQVPGVLAGEYLGKGVGYGTVSMRGFNGEGVLNAVKLLIDGVPSNANDGNTYYIDMVPRLDIETVEVVKGTNDPRYGLHNIAGNVNLVTKQGGNYTQGRVTAGSFGTTGVQAAKGIENENVSQNYAFGYQRSNGFRDHSDANATNFSGKWFVKSGGGQSRIGLIVKHLQNEAQEPGYLTSAEFSANPWQMAPKSATDRDERRATQVAVQAESAVNGQLHVSGQVYMNELFDERYVKFPDSSRQERRLLDERHVGASVNATYRMGQTSLGDTVLVGGVDTERQDNFNYRNRPATDTAANVVRRDHQYNFNTLGAFVQAAIKPTPKLTVTPAYRVDKIDGDAQVRVDTGTGAVAAGTYPVNDYGLIKQPKLSVAYKVKESVTAYGNVGRTFQVGTGKAAFKTSSSNVLPSINNGWEFGLKLLPSSWFNSRIAVWEQTASSETRTLLANPANDTVNVGETKRHGVDLEFNGKPTSALGIWGGVSVQKAEILSTGKEVDHVPHVLYSLGMDYRINNDWKVGSSITGQSSYFIDTTNPEKTGAYTLVNASVDYKLNKTTDVDFQVRNLTNQLYRYSYDNVYAGSPGNFYAPNAPRSFYAGINFKL
jgi:iron complex outermembrane receptor protein